MIREPLIWSGLIIGGVIGIFSIAFFGVFIHHFLQLKKFQNKGAEVFEQKNILNFVIFLFVISLLTYLGSLVLGIYYLSYKGSTQTEYKIGLSFEIVFLGSMILILILMILLILFQNTIILIFTNETLLTLNEIISAKDIVQIRRDNHRKWIFINWKDPKQKRVREIKLKYSYKIKDFLKNNKLWQEQEPIK